METENKKPKKPKKLPYVLLIFAFYLLFTGIFAIFILLIEKGYVPQRYTNLLLFGFAAIIIGGNILFTKFFRAGYDAVKSDDSRYSFFVNKRDGTAFLAYYNWVGASTDLYIPDEVDGCKVIALGGKDRNEKKHEFHIKISPEALGCDKVVYEEEFIKKHKANDEYEKLVFNVKIARNLFKFGNVAPSCKNAYLIKEKRNENGKKEYDFVYKIVYCFTVDASNEHIYSKNGRLYSKEKNIPINVFSYE